MSTHTHTHFCKASACLCANKMQVHPKNPYSNKGTDHKLQPWPWKPAPGNKWIDKSDITNTGTNHRAVARSSQWCHPSMPSGQQKDLWVEWRGASWVSGQSEALVCHGGHVCVWLALSFEEPLECFVSFIICNHYVWLWYLHPCVTFAVCGSVTRNFCSVLTDYYIMYTDHVFEFLYVSLVRECLCGLYLL